jgi:hypothetical protein
MVIVMNDPVTPNMQLQGTRRSAWSFFAGIVPARP